jgi:hypothetical protein
MFDKGKVLGGLAVFLCLATFPLWYMAAQGKAAYPPGPVIYPGSEQCVESAEYMRKYHTQVLQQWRDQAVRQGDRVYTATDNKTYDISLTGSCLKCHPNKAEFCDRCHNYNGIAPNCYSCHNIPPQPTGASGEMK